MLPAVVLYRIGLVLMRTQEGNSLGVSNFLLTVVAWLLTVIFRPSACIPCLQASTHIAREYSLLPPHPSSSLVPCSYGMSYPRCDIAPWRDRACQAACLLVRFVFLLVGIYMLVCLSLCLFVCLSMCFNQSSNQSINGCLFCHPHVAGAFDYVTSAVCLIHGMPAAADTLVTADSCCTYACITTAYSYTYCTCGM